MHAVYLAAMSTPHEYKEKPGACKACGNSPVNHTVSYIFNTLNVLFSMLSRRLAHTTILERLDTGARVLMDTLDIVHTRVMGKLGLVRWGTEVAQARTYRSQVIWEEARRRGIPMEQMFLFGTATDTYRAHVRGAWQYFKSIPLPPEVPQNSYLWVDDKLILKQALAELKVPAPKAVSVCSLAAARAAFAQIGAPVVVKPRCGSRGRHTTTAIETEKDLIAAFKVAKQLCHFVSIERYLAGPVCRGTVIGNKLVGFFEAFPPTVEGDGHSTVAQLIENTNAARHERVQAIIATGEHEAQLARQGLTLDSVLQNGHKISLTHRTGRLFGGVTRELLETVHPKLREYLEKAATGLDVPVVGFDLIIPDPEADPENQEWGIIEANSLPFIDLHYLPLYGKPSNPAAAVWDLWKSE
ncbi:MAG: Cyanophycin synthetase [Candidatus Parcubacteria bacterium]|jgi:D-alanine-D-alanine ligase-like ATP-grasp enzyme